MKLKITLTIDSDQNLQEKLSELVSAIKKCSQFNDCTVNVNVLPPTIARKTAEPNYVLRDDSEELAAKVLKKITTGVAAQMEHSQTK